MGGNRKDVQDLVAEAADQGWRIRNRGDKVLLFSPDGQTIVTLHRTPSDHRWLQNAYRDLRRGGFIRRNP